MLAPGERLHRNHLHKQSEYSSPVLCCAGAEGTDALAIHLARCTRVAAAQSSAAMLRRAAAPEELKSERIRDRIVNPPHL